MTADDRCHFPVWIPLKLPGAAITERLLVPTPMFLLGISVDVFDERGTPWPREIFDGALFTLEDGTDSNNRVAVVRYPLCALPRFGVVRLAYAHVLTSDMSVTARIDLEDAARVALAATSVKLYWRLCLERQPITREQQMEELRTGKLTDIQPSEAFGWKWYSR